MTLRTKELNSGHDLDQYSQELLRQSNEKISTYNLGGKESLFSLDHPALIRTIQLYNFDSSQLRFKNNSYGWYFQTFRTRQEAQANYPDLVVYEGYPKDLYRFLVNSPTQALIDFQQLGSILIQSTPFLNFSAQLPNLQDYLMSVWLDYALSPELWGPAGKWTRFHLRLHSIFSQRNLLMSEDCPGYYPLSKTILWIKDHGFYGNEENNAFKLTLPWDFPLSGLVKLENVLAQEP